jgi:hypothetical protein
MAKVCAASNAAGRSQRSNAAGMETERRPTATVAPALPDQRTPCWPSGTPLARMRRAGANYATPAVKACCFKRSEAKPTFENAAGMETERKPAATVATTLPDQRTPCWPAAHSTMGSDLSSWPHSHRVCRPAVSETGITDGGQKGRSSSFPHASSIQSLCVGWQDSDCHVISFVPSRD